jgi:hypothetical protein
MSNTQNEKPNCYECKHRGSVAGDAHSCCRHPEVSKVVDVSMGMFGIALMYSNPNKINVLAQKMDITAEPHGIQNGWFVWPFNFDPTWLHSCNGFDKKES